MITDNEKFIEIQAILASSNINTRDCAKINDLIIELSKENQELKEKLDKYENPEDMTLMMMWCTEKVKDENEKLTKQLEETDRKLFLTKNELDMREKSIDNKLNQQKEFIKWLEDYLNLFDYRDIEEQAGYDMIEEILQKYKEIIGEK